MSTALQPPLLAQLPYSGSGGENVETQPADFSFSLDRPQQYNCGERTSAVSFGACIGLQKRSSGAEEGVGLQRGADESFRAASSLFPHFAIAYRFQSLT